MRAAHEAPRCQHIRFNGQRCAAPALRGQEHCHFHDQARTARILVSTDVPFIEDATSLQFVLMDVIRTLRTGHAEYKYCALMLYALQIAGANLKNFMAEHPRPDLAEGERPQARIAARDGKKMASENGDEPSLAEFLLGKLAQGENDEEAPRIRSREDYYAAVRKRDAARPALPAKTEPAG